MIYWDSVNAVRLNETVLRQRVVPEAVDLGELGIHPLDISEPRYDPVGYRLEDAGTIGSAQQGFRIDWRLVEQPVATVRSALRKAAAAQRWKAEVGGCVVDGAVIQTDRDTQSKLTGAALEAELSAREGRPYAVRWLTPDGFTDLDGEGVVALARAVRTHVQACFDRQADLWAEIDAAPAVADLLAIGIDTGWPAGGQADAAPAVNPPWAIS